MDTEWHLPDDDIRRYVAQALAPPALWSADAHLAACARCRARLSGAVEPELVGAGWRRLEVELDAPRPGPIERLLVRAGVPDHTARLLAATPSLRLSWLAAVTSTLVLSALMGSLADPIAFLTMAPLLPVAGVALSFGPRVDPTYEVALVAPMHTFRLLLLRCAAVLSVTTALSLAVTLAVPDLGLVAIGWFLPSLALTVTCLALTPRFGPVTAAVAVGLGWLALVGATAAAGSGGSPVFVPAGQVVLALATVMVAAFLARHRRAFETSRRFR
ncbi:hypothetical protein ACTMTJ_07945 [Phytohabitans sp. LJ34]|uniref:hypothetical protein n=1 Tax=Phytohabitans sp. LJ34 TaxID=3452217 RepID=UPI003F898F53